MSHVYSSLEAKSSLSDLSSDIESVRYPAKPKRPFSFVNVALFALLSIGWVLYFLKPQQIGISSPPLASYARPSLTPLPSEVFEVRKQTFNRDDRYIGFSNEVNHNWDHLVAGKYLFDSQIKSYSKLINTIQATTHSGLKIQRTMACQMGRLPHFLMRIWLIQYPRDFM
jgi:hypothetical protein